VYRAILRGGWLDPDRKTPQRIKTEAVFRREPRIVKGVRDRRDEDGLSVSIASMTTPRECAQKFRECFGIASLHVGRLRDLGVQVEPDPDDETKALLVNLPYENPEEADMEKFASDVADSARLVECYYPSLKKPSA